MEAASFDVGAEICPVIPNGIAVGRKRHFECFVSAEFNGFSVSETARLIFDRCCLENWGWSVSQVRLRRNSKTAEGTTWIVVMA